MFSSPTVEKNFKKTMILAVISKKFQFVAHYGGVHGALRISLKSFIKAEVEFYIVAERIINQNSVTRKTPRKSRLVQLGFNPFIGPLIPRNLISGIYPFHHHSLNI